MQLEERLMKAAAPRSRREDGLNAVTWRILHQIRWFFTEIRALFNLSIFIRLWGSYNGLWGRWDDDSIAQRRESDLFGVWTLLLLLLLLIRCSKPCFEVGCRCPQGILLITSDCASSPLDEWTWKQIRAATSRTRRHCETKKTNKSAIIKLP